MAVPGTAAGQLRARDAHPRAEPDMAERIRAFRAGVAKLTVFCYAPGIQVYHIETLWKAIRQVAPRRLRF